MTWFKVDDKFHSHNKIRKVIADDPAALALWVVAGSWSSDNSTDGFVPDHQLPWLIPAGADELAQKLVTARLWRRVRGGYQFHDFADWNPLAKQVRDKQQKRAEAGRKGGLNSGKKRSKQQANASANAPPNAEAKTNPDPTRPPSFYEGGTGERAPASQGAAHAPPPTNSPAVDWRTLPAYGTPPDPTHAQRATRGAAAARQAIRNPNQQPKRQPGQAIDALNQALAELQPPKEEDHD